MTSAVPFYMDGSLTKYILPQEKYERAIDMPGYLVGLGDEITIQSSP